MHLSHSITLRASRGWDVRMGDEEDYEEIATFVKSLGGSMNSDLSSFSWHIAESSVDERILGCIGTQLIDRVATIGFVAVR